MQLTMHGKMFVSLPSLHGANVAMQVGSNLFPPTQLTWCGGRTRWDGGGLCCHYDKERHGGLTQNAACAGEIILLACRDIFWKQGRLKERCSMSGNKNFLV